MIVAHTVNVAKTNRKGLFVQSKAESMCSSVSESLYVDASNASVKESNSNPSASSPNPRPLGMILSTKEDDEESSFSGTKYVFVFSKEKAFVSSSFSDWEEDIALSYRFCSSRVQTLVYTVDISQTFVYHFTREKHTHTRATRNTR